METLRRTFEKFEKFEGVFSNSVFGVAVCCAVLVPLRVLASPPHWEAICESPGAPLTMWAFPKIFETLEAACLDATQRLCAAAASAAKRGVQTLPLDNGQVVLLVQSGSAWFAHTGLIAPETQRAVQPLLGAHPLVLGSDHR